MKVFFHGITRTVDPSMQLMIGRDVGADILLSDSDRLISRRAAVLQHDGAAWVVHNTGRRSFYLVEPGGELEIAPTSSHSRRRILHHHTWLRFPGASGDYGVVVAVPAAELPDRAEPFRDGSGGHTIDELDVSLTENERTSLCLIYEGYLRLPPHYTRRANSFRAVAARLGVEEGKIKADHRRVVDKVVRAGGPPDASTNRDALVAWLVARDLLTFEFVEDE